MALISSRPTSIVATLLNFLCRQQSAVHCFDLQNVRRVYSSSRPCLSSVALASSSSLSNSEQYRQIHYSAETSRHNDDTNKATSLSRAQDTFSLLSKKKRTWQRLRPLVELACVDEQDEAADTTVQRSKSIADIGCDHGYLALALAVSGRFDSVVGVDVSERALRDGAITCYQQLLNNLPEGDRCIPLDFRAGQGLKPLVAGEADTVCIAGMGVSTILKCLCVTELDRIQCRRLIVQPTNSRPRNLILLYDKLQASGWILCDEKIEFISSRWYISVAFVKDEKGVSPSLVLPGSILSQVDLTNVHYNVYEEYVRHHKSWLDRDVCQRKAILDCRDERWLQSFDA